MGLVTETADTPQLTPRTALAVRGVSKAFAGTRALVDFDLELRGGEVHALVGGNGSGKSTLIKLLAGVYQADAGELETSVGTAELADQTPGDAQEHGLRFVHQDPAIFPILSVAENLAIGRGFPTGFGGRVRWGACHREARETLARFLVDIDPSAPAASLTTPQRAMLAIARALQTIPDDQRAILVLDEPTAALPPEEAALLLASIRTLADQGQTVLLVTHRLDEVRRSADRVTGVRDGRRVGTIDAASVTEDDMVQLILGRRLEAAQPPAAPRRTGLPALELRGLSGGPLHNVDLAVHAGEIVGIAGLLGSGRTELLEMIFGVRPRDAGDILIAGEPVMTVDSSGMRRRGVAFVPEDRQAAGVFPNSTVAENVTAGDLGAYRHRGRIRERRLRQDVERDMSRFHVKASSVRARIETLSGGNQQKVVLARWLRAAPDVLLLDEPTQGIDVGAREEIFSLIQAATDAGTAVVLVSSELEELTRLAHRIVVLNRGVIAGEFAAGASSHDILQAVLESARSVDT